MTKDVSILSYAIWMSSRMRFISFSHLKITFYCWVLRVSCIFWIKIPKRSDTYVPDMFVSDVHSAKYFLSVYGLSFHSLIIPSKSFYLIKTKLCIFSFMDCAFGFISKNSRTLKVPQFFSYTFVQKFYSFAFYIRFIIHFELVYFFERCLCLGIFFANECPIVPAPVVEKTVLSLLNWFCSIINDQLTIFV